jgi:hypothetical protein
MMEIYWNDSSFVFGQDGYLTTDKINNERLTSQGYMNSLIG